MHTNSNNPPKIEPQTPSETRKSKESGGWRCQGDSNPAGAGAIPMPESKRELGGYQWVSLGNVQEGDIYVSSWNNEVHPVDDDVMGKPINKDWPQYPWAIYRKMPCPSALSDHEDCKKYPNDCPPDWDEVQRQTDMAMDKFAKEMADKAATYDEGKPPLAYLPWGGIDEVAMVQAYGHKKYKDFNNYRKGMEVGRNLSCAIRHIRAYMEGEDLDPESGRNHLAHACCRLLFTLQNIKDGKAIDDRHKKGTK